MILFKIYYFNLILILILVLKMNGKLPANNFTCPQSYLRPNILYYQGGPQIQQQNQAMPGIPYYFIPSQSFTPYLTGFGCTATINTAPAAAATAPQKGLPKGAVNTHAVPPPKASNPIPVPGSPKRPFSITKYDWHASTFVFSEKPYAYEMEKLDRTLAMLNGEKLYLEEDDLPSISVSTSTEIEKEDIVIPETPENKNKK